MLPGAAVFTRPQFSHRHHHRMGLTSFMTGQSYRRDSGQTKKAYAGPRAARARLGRQILITYASGSSAGDHGISGYSSGHLHESLGWEFTAKRWLDT